MGLLLLLDLVFGSNPNNCPCYVPQGSISTSLKALTLPVHNVCIQLKTQVIKKRGNVPKMINDLLLSEKKTPVTQFFRLYNSEVGLNFFNTQLFF